MSRNRLSRIRAALIAIVGAVTLIAAIPAAASASGGGWWLLDANVSPTSVAPGKKALIQVTTINAGHQEITSSTPVKVTVAVPAGLKVVNVHGEAGPYTGTVQRSSIPLTCNLAQNVVCEMTTGAIHPWETIRIGIRTEAEGTLKAGEKLETTAHIEGGRTPEAAEPGHVTQTKTTEVSNEPVKAGVERYELRPENADGTLDTQAGSHPFQLTTIFDQNQLLKLHQSFTGPQESSFVPALPKNLHFLLPPGMIGAVANTPQCSATEFTTILTGTSNQCAPNTVLGVASITVDEPVSLGTATFPLPVFNLVPAPGEPARFGFEVDRVPVVLTTHVRSGTDYAVEASVELASQAVNILSSTVTLWGAPADARHDNVRGWECVGNGIFMDALGDERHCEPHSQPNPEAFLTMPTSCEGTPESIMTGETWPISGTLEELPKSQPLHKEYQFTSPFTGCGLLPFEPSIGVEPDTHAASTPSGFTVRVHLPQASTISGNEKSLAESAVRETVLTLPAGVAASAGAADGLTTCSAGQLGIKSGFEEGAALENNLFTPNPGACPESSKIGTVTIKTPLLKNELHGFAYLAYQNTNPFASPLVLYFTAEDPADGIVAKLAGTASLDPNNGQVVSVFKNTPQVPFEDLTLHLFDGPQAVQSTPPFCGTYTTSSSFTPWSVPTPATPSGAFEINKGPNGEACTPQGSPRPLTPSFNGGSENPKAGEYTHFTVTINRPDADQQINGVTVHLPPGIAATLKNVTPCPEPPVGTEWSCGDASWLGTATTSAGLGSDPVTLKGKAYLTTGYDGAPFGLLVSTDATHVGPFNVGIINVRSRINVDEHTAAVTITTDPGPRGESLPTFLKGVPVQLKQLNVTVERPEFQFNPTNCSPTALTGTLHGDEGANTPVSWPYQVTGCASLPFKPTISVNVESNYSRLDGTGMKIKVTSSKGQANIKKTKLVFPSSVPSRLTTIQKACPSQTFNANPASCPEGSVIGTAIARTPVLKSPLTGPAYLVSHANESFPDAVFVLQGEGIKLVLDGKTNIKNGITSSTFETVPDAPVESFEVTLPRGPHSAFSGYGDLCEKPLEVPTTFGGQNGALIENTTKVTVENCGGVKKAKTESELAKLLKKCKKVKNHKKRVKCEATARKQVKAVATCKKKNKGHTKKLNACVARARKTYALKLK
jgi:hypothetical protein